MIDLAAEKRILGSVFLSFVPKPVYMPTCLELLFKFLIKIAVLFLSSIVKGKTVQLVILPVSSSLMKFTHFSAIMFSVDPFSDGFWSNRQVFFYKISASNFDTIP